MIMGPSGPEPTLIVLAKTSRNLLNRPIDLVRVVRQKNMNMGPRRGGEPTMTVLAKASSNLPDRRSKPKRAGIEGTREVHVFWTGTDREISTQESKEDTLTGKPLNLNGRCANG
jgi:hypothetical protein